MDKFNFDFHVKPNTLELGFENDEDAPIIVEDFNFIKI